MAGTCSWLGAACERIANHAGPTAQLTLMSACPPACATCAHACMDAHASSHAHACCAWEHVCANTPVAQALHRVAGCLRPALPPGITSDNVAKQYNVSREEQDKAALASHQKAAAAQVGRPAGK